MSIATEARTPAHEAAQGLVTMTLAGQEVAISVATVQDVLGPQPLTPVPRSYPEIAGLLNLRGRIVTAIDLRRRLKMAGSAAGEQQMNVVIDHAGELYSLLVSGVGEVLDCRQAALETDTSLLSPSWRSIASGIYALEARLLIALEIGRVLDFQPRA